ncbi:PilZ domain-containing protein [Novosphingobium cyanobacteriorum]|uniref:PilZ domain-containing protein n=1 Tax=Novosphingobium cyanobacteriorum TaxID=3024215 RepID=A0ABT6CNC3_9SPHN|nr:PilZ domain-containing protein [Novosphingobium cyanobacteriorum]MDF8335014.1 PilZ domain-containing protein [Novosphingobium cyanobacteriorum]
MTTRDRRKTHRIASENVIHVRSAMQKIHGVSLVDLSVSGCRVKVLGSSIAAGQLLIVRPEGIEGLEGVVRWVEDGEAGIEFNRPLHPSVLDHLVSQPHPSHGEADSVYGRTPVFGSSAMLPISRRFEVYRSVA